MSSNHYKMLTQTRKKNTKCRHVFRKFIDCSDHLTCFSLIQNATLHVYCDWIVVVGFLNCQSKKGRKNMQFDPKAHIGSLKSRVLLIIIIFHAQISAVSKFLAKKVERANT
jgi:hypothetical protein